jgi:membrane fusion protein (multidrug efflux system)
MTPLSRLRRKSWLPGCSWLLAGLLVSSIQPAAAQSRMPIVVIAESEQAALVEEVSLSGSVISPRIAQLSTEVDGLIESISVDIGDRVRAGDEILRLNAELVSLSLDAARAATAQATHQLADARRRLAEAGKLVKSNNIPASQYESLAAEVSIDNAELQRYQAEQKTRQAELDRHKLKAPFDGVISRRLAEQGEWIQPGEPVVELAGTTNLRIDFQVPQTVFGMLQQNARLVIGLDALPGRSFDGVLESIVPVTNPATRTFLVRGRLEDPDVRLMPGMSASAVLYLDSKSRGVVIERDALIRYPDGRTTVWVVEQGQVGDEVTVSERLVQTGINMAGKVAIREGLEAGTPVVVEGNEGLRNGQKVIIKRNE